MSLDTPVPAGKLVQLAASDVLSQSPLVLEKPAIAGTGNTSGRVSMVLPSSALGPGTPDQRSAVFSLFCSHPARPHPLLLRVLLGSWAQGAE